MPLRLSRSSRQTLQGHSSADRTLPEQNFRAPGRIDIHIDVPPLRYGEMHQHTACEPSSAIRQRVVEARALQHQRFGCAKTNAQLTTAEIKKFCSLDGKSWFTLQRAVDNMGLSARACDRILRVSRTIADLAASPTLDESHLLEALNLRNIK